MFAEKGYTAVEINIAAPTHPPSPPSSSSTSHGPFSSMTSLLASQIRLLAIPFPPILVGEGMTCLLTQSYVSDNPASGLVMLNPPPDTDIRINAEREREGGWEWPTFNYEPRFPILVLADEGRMKGLKEGSRVARAAEGGVWRGGKGVSVEVMGEGDERGEETRVVSLAIEGDGRKLMWAFRRSRGGWTAVAFDLFGILWLYSAARKCLYMPSTLLKGCISPNRASLVFRCFSHALEDITSTSP